MHIQNKKLDVMIRYACMSKIFNDIIKAYHEHLIAVALVSVVSSKGKTLKGKQRAQSALDVFVMQNFEDQKNKHLVCVFFEELRPLREFDVLLKDTHTHTFSKVVNSFFKA